MKKTLPALRLNRDSFVPYTSFPRRAERTTSSSRRENRRKIVRPHGTWSGHRRGSCYLREISLHVSLRLHVRLHRRETPNRAWQTRTSAHKQKPALRQRSGRFSILQVLSFQSPLLGVNAQAPRDKASPC